MKSTKSQHSLVHALLVCTTLIASGQLQAGSPVPEVTVNEKNPPVTFAPQASPWAISAGAAVRSIKSDFHLSAPPALDTRGLVHQQRGLGDVGLFNGGSNKVYDNGSVGPDYAASPDAEQTTPTGAAIANGGNIRSTGGFDSDGRPISAFDFHTHSYSYSNSLDSRNVDVRSSDTGVGPYLELSRRVVDRASLIMDVFAGWSYVQTTHSSGYPVVARQSVAQHDVLHTYSYQGINTSDPFFDSPPAGFPNASGLVVYDPALLNNSLDVTGYKAPHQTNKASNNVVAGFYAATGGTLNVHLNEVPIGVKVGRKFGCLSVLAELGGSLDVIDYDLNAQTTWYRANGASVSRQTWHGSGAPVKVGAFAGLTLQCDLSKDGRWFLEAHGTYRWVDTAQGSAGPVTARIDVSSWEGGAGLGFRF